PSTCQPHQAGSRIPNTVPAVTPARVNSDRLNFAPITHSASPATAQVIDRAGGLAETASGSTFNTSRTMGAPSCLISVRRVSFSESNWGEGHCKVQIENCKLQLEGDYAPFGAPRDRK